MKKESQLNLNNKKDQVMSLKEKIKFLESENSFLKSDINIKQKMIDSILEHNFNLLNHQMLTMKSIKKVVKPEKRN